MTDDQKKMLETAAQSADRIADSHSPTCGTGQLMRLIGDSARAALGGGAARSGPAQVATEAYRQNWDTLFGSKQTVGQA